jgi:hypothetical protein
MQKRVSPMNLVVALSVVLLESNKPEAIVDTLHVHNVKCSLLFVQLAGKKQPFLSNLQVTSQYIAVIAINHVHVVIGKHLIKAFPGLFPGKAFLFSTLLCRLYLKK